MLKIVSRLFSVSILVALIACAPKYVEIPSYEGMGLKDALAAKRNIAGIDTMFSLVYEKEDSEIKGDGVVYISRSGYVNMRIYSFGFLAFELSSANGAIKSSPAIDKNKALILTDGLRDCLFWWDIKDFDTQEKEGKYILTNSRRQVWIDGKTMLPVRQIISVEDGRELDIYYENPEKIGEIWYPSRIRIELSKNTLTLRIKDISFILDT